MQRLVREGLSIISSMFPTLGEEGGGVTTKQDRAPEFCLFYTKGGHQYLGSMRVLGGPYVREPALVGGVDIAALLESLPSVGDFALLRACSGSSSARWRLDDSGLSMSRG
jgi:hypothetical protein